MATICNSNTAPNTHPSIAKSSKTKEINTTKNEREPGVQNLRPCHKKDNEEGDRKKRGRKKWKHRKKKKTEEEREKKIERKE